MNCNWMGRRAAALVMGFLLLGTTIAPAGAQQSIGADDGRVVDIDANTVRIDGEDPVTVSGDWRRQGQVYDDAELRRVVINLGGSVDADRIWLNLAGDVLFGFDSSEVTPEAAAHPTSALQAAPAAILMPIPDGKSVGYALFWCIFRISL